MVEWYTRRISNELEFGCSRGSVSVVVLILYVYTLLLVWVMDLEEMVVALTVLQVGIAVPAEMEGLKPLPGGLTDHLVHLLLITERVGALLRQPVDLTVGGAEGVDVGCLQPHQPRKGHQPL